MSKNKKSTKEYLLVYSHSDYEVQMYKVPAGKLTRGERKEIREFFGQDEYKDCAPQHNLWPDAVKRMHMLAFEHEEHYTGGPVDAVFRMGPTEFEESESEESESEESESEESESEESE